MASFWLDSSLGISPEVGGEPSTVLTARMGSTFRLAVYSTCTSPVFSFGSIFLYNKQFVDGFKYEIIVFLIYSVEVWLSGKLITKKVLVFYPKK